MNSNNNNQMNYRKSNLKITSYPEDLSNHFIVFTFAKYHRSDVTEPAKVSLDNSIALPIPSNINEQVALSWSDSDTWSVAADVLAEGIGHSDNIAAAFDTIGKRTTSGIEKLRSDPIGTFKKITAFAAKKIGVINEAALSTFTGIAVNPNIALVFKGQAGTREHSFSWKLVPESEKDSSRIRDVIRQFRRMALPFLESSFFIDYPNECQISIFGSELGFMPFYKKCVITSLEVNYTPESIPTFMKKTGAPAAVQLNLTLKETTQLFRNDIDIFDPDAKNNKLLNIEDSNTKAAKAMAATRDEDS